MNFIDLEKTTIAAIQNDLFQTSPPTSGKSWKFVGRQGTKDNGVCLYYQGDLKDLFDQIRINPDRRVIQGPFIMLDNESGCIGFGSIDRRDFDDIQDLLYVICRRRAILGIPAVKQDVWGEQDIENPDLIVLISKEGVLKELNMHPQIDLGARVDGFGEISISRTIAKDLVEIRC